jgi:hypothetical protein
MHARGAVREPASRLTARSSLTGAAGIVTPAAAQ